MGDKLSVIGGAGMFTINMAAECFQSNCRVQSVPITITIDSEAKSARLDSALNSGPDLHGPQCSSVSQINQR